MEELNPETILRWLEGKNLSILERVLITHDGTVQSLLSYILQCPVTIEVLSQEEGPESILRRVYLRAGDLVCAKATSYIPLGFNSHKVSDLVQQKTLGLGQIAKVLGIETTRTIMDLGVNKESFWREYRMTGSGLLYRITEVFPRTLYQELIAQENRRPVAL